jgi:hypothetical protein
VQKDIDEGKVKPGQYFVLKFDFSKARSDQNLTEANAQLIKFLNASIMNFYDTYASYLDKDLTNLCRTIDSDTPTISLESCVRRVHSAIMRDRRLAALQGVYLLVDEYDAFPNNYLQHTLGASKTEWADTEVARTLKSFWSTVKSLSGDGFIKRIFITGISPLSLSDAGSSFNIARNVSFDKRLAGLCGLTSLDLKIALRRICDDEESCRRHLEEMKAFFNGYHFSQGTDESVFNTETCLAYLQDLLDGEQPETANPANSEVSAEFLNICASSASVTRDFQAALDGPISYDHFPTEITLRDLVC